MLSPKARELLEIQRRKYLGSLQDKKARIGDCWAGVQASAWEAGEVDRLRTEIHRLAGSAGSYGLDDLGAIAQIVDRMLASDTDSAQQRFAIGGRIDELLEALDEVVID
jgi:hypothetical protein